MKRRKNLSLLITIILFIGIVAQLTGIIPGISLFIMLSGLILAFIYSILVRGISQAQKTFLLLMSGITLLNPLFIILHLPGAEITHLSLTIPMGLFAYISFKHAKELKPEYPFLLMIAIVALLSFF